MYRPAMKVHELIEALSKQDSQAEVLVDTSEGTYGYVYGVYALDGVWLDMHCEPPPKKKRKKAR